MYLDTDGDGVRTAADTLAQVGPTHVGIWIVTDRNRDGSPAKCDGGAGMTIHSYELILRCRAGAGVRWGEYENLQKTMTVSLGIDTSRTEFHCGFSGSVTLPPGRYELGSLTVTANPFRGLGPTFIALVPDSPLGATYRTAFGSSCPGRDGDRTLKLGTDWVDVDALASGERGYVDVMSSSRGVVYFGGNRIGCPCELAYVAGQLAINGWALPPPGSRIISHAKLNDEEKAEAAFEQRVADTSDSLRKVGFAPPAIAEVIRAMCAANPLVDSVLASSQAAVGWRFRSKRRSGIDLSVMQPPPAPRSLAQNQQQRLASLQQLLGNGSLMFITGDGEELIVPSGRQADGIDSLVARVRVGQVLGKNASPLTRSMQAQIRSPLHLVRVK